MSMRAHRHTIVLEDAEILDQRGFDGGQYGLRVRAPELARRAEPGTFAHIRVDPAIPMRRPMSLMLTHPGKGTVDFLYKVVGPGSRRLSERRPGERLSVLGPIGRPFRPDPARPRALLVGGGVGIPPTLFLAERLRRESYWKPLVLMGSEVPFPFEPRPSQVLVPHMPEGVIACMPLLEGWGIASRLARGAGRPGCYEGTVTALARHWLERLDPDTRAEVAVYACGPHPMLAAAARLAADFELPCQVCLEEYMACAVGGCMGCTVRLRSAAGESMRRVCVDGPVFDAAEVVWG